MPARGQFKLTVRARQVFGRLCVIRNLRRYRKADGDIRYRVLCQCSCGRKTRVSKFELLRRETESCGCLSRELLAKRNQENPPTKTHGATSKSASPALRRTFSSWKAAKARTTNPNGKDHHLYYDRGIKMCRRWFNSFAAFLKDMGERPESMTLDRKNPDKDYTKSNCRWADATTQTNNRRKQRYVKRPTLRMPLVWESNRTPLVTTVTDSGASDQLLEKRGYMKYMTEETMNELKQTEKAYDAAIAAATNETHKAGLEKLKGFISDAIDHELFDRAEGRDCQIKYVSGDSDVGMPCGKPAVASCGDCGSAICSDCQQECCGDSFCGQCYEYHERLPV